ncbi:hypothetical protein F6B41_12285 [Microbacterium lushaniae]|nr:hypothetical protein F6B41_12285 [Microbacterium lushaniae]
MTGTAGNRNVALHQAVRELVSAYLETRGFDTTPKPRESTLNAALGSGIVPDVSGIPGVHLDVTSRAVYRLSVDLDSARAGADVTGHPVAAFVQHRAGRPIEQSFVILELGDFATLAKLASHELASP